MARKTVSSSKSESTVIPNAKGAFLVGNPQKAEVTVLRVKLPPHCKHPPHHHPFAEVATVLGGRLGYGLGDVFDTSKGQMLEAGTFAVVPANDPIISGPTMRKRLSRSNSSGRLVSTMSPSDPKR